MQRHGRGQGVHAADESCYIATWYGRQPQDWRTGKLSPLVLTFLFVLSPLYLTITIPPPPPLYSIMIKLLFYHRLLTPMKTCEPPPCQRRSLRLRPKASPAYARGPAPLVPCLGLFLLSPLLVPPFPLIRLMVFCPRLVPPPNKTGSGKTLQDRIRQDPHKAKQDPLQSAPPPLILPPDSPTPTPSNLYL